MKKLNYIYDNFFDEDGWIKDEVCYVAIGENGEVEDATNNREYYEQNNYYKIICLDNRVKGEIQDSSLDFEKWIIKSLD